MARIPYPDIASLGESARKLIESMPVKLNILRMAGHLDDGCSALLQLGGHILTAQKLSPVLRELAILRVARLSSAEYEWVQHVPFAEDVGVTADQINALDKGQREGDSFDETEALVLAFTDEVVHNVRPSDLILGALREILSDQEVVELTTTIGFYMLMARIMEVTGVDVDAPGGLEVVKALTAGAKA